jgi:hypothetical protein
LLRFIESFKRRIELFGRSFAFHSLLRFIEETLKENFGLYSSKALKEDLSCFLASFILWFDSFLRRIFKKRYQTF